MNATKKTGYSAIRLNFFSEESWAVICKESGAIVLDPEGRLMTRMTQIKAHEVAARLSAESKSLDDTPCR